MKFRESPLQTEDYEQELGLSLPPIYKSFITQFEGVFGDIIQNQRGELETLTYYQYLNREGEDLMFEDFLPIVEMFNNHKNSDSWVENGVIPISSHSHGGTILLGIHSSNMDKLFYEHDRGLEFIENDIFSFLRNLTFIMEQTVEKDKVIKKWDKEYWQVND